MYTGNIWGICGGDKLTIIHPSWEKTYKEEILITSMPPYYPARFLTRYDVEVEEKDTELSWRPLHNYFMKRDLVFFGWDLPIIPCNHNFMHKHQLKEDKTEYVYLSGDKKVIRSLVETQNLNIVFNKYSDIVICQNDKEEFLFPEFTWQNLQKLSHKELMIILTQRDHWAEKVMKKFPSTEDRLSIGY